MNDQNMMNTVNSKDQSRTQNGSYYDRLIKKQKLYDLPH